MQTSFYMGRPFLFSWACVSGGGIAGSGAFEVFQRGGSVHSSGRRLFRGSSSGWEWAAPGWDSRWAVGGTQLLLQTRSRAPFPPSSRAASDWPRRCLGFLQIPEECVHLLKIKHHVLWGPLGLLTPRFPSVDCVCILSGSGQTHTQGGLARSLLQAGGKAYLRTAMTTAGDGPRVLRPHGLLCWGHCVPSLLECTLIFSRSKWYLRQSCPLISRAHITWAFGVFSLWGTSHFKNPSVCALCTTAKELHLQEFSVVGVLTRGRCVTPRKCCCFWVPS